MSSDNDKQDLESTSSDQSIKATPQIYGNEGNEKMG